MFPYAPDRDDVDAEPEIGLCASVPAIAVFVVSYAQALFAILVVWTLMEVDEEASGAAHALVMIAAIFFFASFASNMGVMLTHIFVFRRRPSTVVSRSNHSLFVPGTDALARASNALLLLSIVLGVLYGLISFILIIIAARGEYTKLWILSAPGLLWIVFAIVAAVLYGFTKRNA